MKNLFVAFAIATFMVACNSQSSQETQETSTDSTTVQVDSCAADSTCKDTCQVKK
jgi:hypothetical protein